MKPHYSGPKSEVFWARVNNIQNEEDQEWIYLMGCTIQDMESRLLQSIKLAERRDKK